VEGFLRSDHAAQAGNRGDHAGSELRSQLAMDREALSIISTLSANISRWQITVAVVCRLEVADRPNGACSAPAFPFSRILQVHPP
jgi:hypothetical protein